MDHQRFDDLARLLGTSGTRRAGLRAALGAVGLIGLGPVAAPDAEAKRRRNRCRPACASGQTCVKGVCICDDGGTVCGDNCCRFGQKCRDGQCVELPEPTTCVAYGEPCKGAGRPCCDGLACGSGQGGGTIACWVHKTGRCASTAECVYGTECTDGVCVGLPQPVPEPACGDVPPGDETALSNAIFAAPAGATIRLGNGTFPLASSNTEFTGRVTLKPCPGAQPIVECYGTANQCILVASGGDLALERIVMRRRAGTFPTGYAIATSNSTAGTVRLSGVDISGFYYGVSISKDSTIECAAGSGNTICGNTTNCNYEADSVPACGCCQG